MAKEWAKAKLDIDFFVDSGLLFHYNHTTLHPLGIALTVVKDKEGNKTFGFKDYRGTPEEIVFDKGVAELAQAKLQKFMSEFGYAQMDRRERKLGRACQRIAQVPDKVEKKEKK